MKIVSTLGDFCDSTYRCFQIENQICLTDFSSHVQEPDRADSRQRRISRDGIVMSQP